jgi:ammonia channel protein AmtB
VFHEKQEKRNMRVSPETEEKGLDIEEHAERAYTDEGEFEKL